MNEEKDIANLEQLLRRLNQAAKGRDGVAVGTILDVVGRKSFGPLLLLAGIIAVSPLSGIPGVPTSMALLVWLTAGQLVFGRKRLWLPAWLVQRTVSRRRFKRALQRLRPAARGLDRLFRPRLTLLTRGIGAGIISLVCLGIAATMPPLELVPFAATTAGAALVVFGLSLTAHDGLMALVALVFTGVAGTVMARTVF